MISLDHVVGSCGWIMCTDAVWWWSGALQDQVQELQLQLEATRKNLAEVSTDRDLFLRRLQQLELEGAGETSGTPGSGGIQRQKAHAAQVCGDWHAKIEHQRNDLCLTLPLHGFAAAWKVCCEAAAGAVV